MSLPAIDVPYCSIKSNPDINCCYPSNSFPKRSCPSINLIASPNDPRITCDWIHSNGYQTSATGRRRSIPSAIVWIIGYSNASSCDSPKHIVLQIIGQILHEAWAFKPGGGSCTFHCKNLTISHGDNWNFVRVDSNVLSTSWTVHGPVITTIQKIGCKTIGDLWGGCNVVVFFFATGYVVEG